VPFNMNTLVGRFSVAGAGLLMATAAYGVEAAKAPPKPAAATKGGVTPAAPAASAPGAVTGKPAVPPPGVPAPAAAAQAPAVPGAATAMLTATVDPAKGRELFNNWGCSSCHALADAGAAGHVGPELDGNSALTQDLVINRVTNGQGAMPAFGGQLTDEEIKLLAAYIVQVKK